MSIAANYPVTKAGKRAAERKCRAGAALGEMEGVEEGEWQCNVHLAFWGWHTHTPCSHPQWKSKRVECLAVGQTEFILSKRQVYFPIDLDSDPGHMLPPPRPYNRAAYSKGTNIEKYIISRTACSILPTSWGRKKGLRKIYIFSCPRSFFFSFSTVQICFSCT